MKNQNIIKRTTALLMLPMCLTQAGVMVYNVRDFGAKGDGITLDSPAINKAMSEGRSSPCGDTRRCHSCHHQGCGGRELAGICY